jgi:zinc transporter ZupT
MNGAAMVRRGALAWLLLPVAVLVGILALLVLGRPLERLTQSAPPVEVVSVETARLTPGMISLRVRADGSQPVSIAQVQVDGAYRSFTQDPAGPIERLDSAQIDIPYPWIEGELHHIVLLTSTGVTFEHTVEVAQETPRIEGATLVTLGLVGLLLGLAPVATGMLAYPALRQLGPRAIRFVLALTVGLLLFLLIDTLGEGLEAAALTIERLHGQALVWVSALTATGVLLLIGRRGGRAPEGLALATFIALGIGLHNFGEGLAVGAAIATGEAALAAFLVIGFTLHNVSEGLGIATPLIGERTTLRTFAGLAILAGLPAVFGVWAGAQAVSPIWTAVCFGIGAGAILQVIVEMVALVVRRDGRDALASAPNVGGIATGLAVMYVTALLV